MYFQPSLIASTPTSSIDPLTISVKKGENNFAAASERECLLKGEKFQFLSFSVFKFFFFMLFVFMFWIIIDGL